MIYCLRIKDNLQNVLVQWALFDKGYRWESIGQKVKEYSYPYYLCIFKTKYLSHTEDIKYLKKMKVKELDNLEFSKLLNKL